MADNVGMTDGSSALNPDYDNAANSSSADTQNAEPASNIIDITSHQRPRAEFDGSQAVTTDDARTSPKFGDGPKIIPFNNNDSLTVSTTQSQDFDGDQLMPIKSVEESRDEDESHRELTPEELVKQAQDYAEGLLGDFGIEGDATPEVQALGEEVADSLRFQLDASKIWKGIRDTYDKVSPVARDIWEGLKASWKSGDAINVSIDELANKKEDVNITAPKEINIAHLDEESINTLVSNTVNLGGQVMIRTEGNIIIVNPADVEAMQKAGYRLFNPAVESVMPSPEDEQLAAQAVDEVLAESGGDGENEDPDFKGNVLYKLARAGVRGFIGTGRLIKDIESQGVGKYKTRMLDENGKEIAWKDMSGWQKLRYVLEDVTGVHTNDSFVRAEDVDAARLVDVFRKRGLTVSKQLLDDAGVEQPGILGEGSLIDRMIKSGSVVDGITMGFRVASMLQPLDIAAKTNFFAQNSVLSPRTLSMVFPAAVRSWRTRSEILRRGGSEEEANKVMMLGLAGALPVGFISYFLANDLAHGVANDIISKLPEGVNTEFTQRLVSTVVPWATSWGIRTGSSKLALPIIQYPLAYVIAGNKDAQGNNIGVKRRAFKAAGLSWKAADIASNAAMGIGAAQYLGVLPHAPGLGVNMLRNLTGSMVENQNASLPNLGNSQAESIAALINSDPQAISRGSFGRSEILSTLRERQFTLGNYERQLEDLQRDPTRLREFIQRNGGNPQMVENEIVRVKNEITRIESQIDSPEMRSRGIFGREGSDESSSERFIDQRPTHSNNATRMQEMFETSDNRRGGFIDLNSQNLEQTLGRMTPEEFNNSVFDVTNKSDHAVSIRVAGLLGDNTQTIISIQPGQSLHQAIIIEGLNPNQLNLDDSENRAFWANQLARHGEFKEVQDLIDSTTNQQPNNVANENYNPQLRPHTNRNNPLDDHVVGEQRNRQLDVNTQNQEVAPEVERNRIVAGTIDPHNIGSLTPGDTVVGRIRTELDTMISSGNYQSAINGAMLQFQSYSPAQQDLFIQELTSRNLLTSSQANALFGRAGDLASLNNLLTENPNTLVILQTILNRHEYELLAAASGSTTPFGTSGPVTVFKEVVAPVDLVTINTSVPSVNYATLQLHAAGSMTDAAGAVYSFNLPPAFNANDRLTLENMLGLMKAGGMSDTEIRDLLADPIRMQGMANLWDDLVPKDGDNTSIKMSDLVSAGILDSSGNLNTQKFHDTLENFIVANNRTFAFRLENNSESLGRLDRHLLQSDDSPEPTRTVENPFVGLQVIPQGTATQQPGPTDLPGVVPTQVAPTATQTGTPSNPPILINGQDAGQVIGNAANDAVNQVATSLPHDTAVGINDALQNFNSGVNSLEDRVEGGWGQVSQAIRDVFHSPVPNIQAPQIPNLSQDTRTFEQILDEAIPGTNRQINLSNIDNVLREIGKPLSYEMRMEVINSLSGVDGIITVQELTNAGLINADGKLNGSGFDNLINNLRESVNNTSFGGVDAEVARGISLSVPQARTTDEIINLLNQTDEFRATPIDLNNFRTNGLDPASPQMQAMIRSMGLIHNGAIGSRDEEIIASLAAKLDINHNGTITISELEEYIGQGEDGKLDMANWQYLVEREMRIQGIPVPGIIDLDNSRTVEDVLTTLGVDNRAEINMQNMREVFRDLGYGRLSFETQQAIFNALRGGDNVVNLTELENYMINVNGTQVHLLNPNGTLNADAMNALVHQGIVTADAQLGGHNAVLNPNDDLRERFSPAPESNFTPEQIIAQSGGSGGVIDVRDADARRLVEIGLGHLPDNLTTDQRNTLINSLITRIAGAAGDNTTITVDDLETYLGSTTQGNLDMQAWGDAIKQEMRVLELVAAAPKTILEELTTGDTPIIALGVPIPAAASFGPWVDILRPNLIAPISNILGPQFAPVAVPMLAATGTVIVKRGVSKVASFAVGRIPVLGRWTNDTFKKFIENHIYKTTDASGAKVDSFAGRLGFMIGEGSPMIGAGIVTGLIMNKFGSRILGNTVASGDPRAHLGFGGAIVGAALASGFGPLTAVGGGLIGGIAGFGIGAHINDKGREVIIEGKLKTALDKFPKDHEKWEEDYDAWELGGKKGKAPVEPKTPVIGDFNVKDKTPGQIARTGYIAVLKDNLPTIVGAVGGGMFGAKLGMSLGQPIIGALGGAVVGAVGANLAVKAFNERLKPFISAIDAYIKDNYGGYRQLGKDAIGLGADFIRDHKKPALIVIGGIGALVAGAGVINNWPVISAAAEGFFTNQANQIPTIAVSTGAGLGALGLLIARKIQGKW